MKGRADRLGNDGEEDVFTQRIGEHVEQRQDGNGLRGAVHHRGRRSHAGQRRASAALPLGMMASAEFSVMRFQLAPNDRLLLLSDGVVEAQDAQGHLFGFERIQALLQKPVTAEQSAASAQQFGQQDDISSLSIARIAVTEPALA
jgi:serine/threonine protein phosphatase PrpC